MKPAPGFLPSVVIDHTVIPSTKSLLYPLFSDHRVLQTDAKVPARSWVDSSTRVNDLLGFVIINCCKTSR
jgi:hypothetical protein